MEAPPRVWLARLAAPAAFLLAATVAVLLVREGLSRSEGREPATTAALTAARGGAATKTARATAAKRRSQRPRRAQPANYYVIQSGDTYGTIAGRYGTSVERLVDLNPGVDPTQLSVGQRIRVP